LLVRERLAGDLLGDPIDGDADRADRPLSDALLDYPFEQSPPRHERRLAPGGVRDPKVRTTHSTNRRPRRRPAIVTPRPSRYRPPKKRAGGRERRAARAERGRDRGRSRG